MLNGFLTLLGTSLLVEAILRGSTDFIELLNLVFHDFWEFVEAAVIAQQVVLFVILLFQLVYVHMQI